jgi:hypothetical protein
VRRLYALHLASRGWVLRWLATNSAKSFRSASTMLSRSRTGSACGCFSERGTKLSRFVSGDILKARRTHLSHISFRLGIMKLGSRATIAAKPGNKSFIWQWERRTARPTNCRADFGGGELERYCCLPASIMADLTPSCLSNGVVRIGPSAFFTSNQIGAPPGRIS